MTNRPEIFIGLIAPIGIDLNTVQEELSDGLRSVGYTCRTVRVTETLEAFRHRFHLDESGYFERYDSYIESGNAFCRETSRNDILVAGAIANLVHTSDLQDSRDLTERSPRFENATVFRQIKRVDEIALLRRVYGNNVIFLGCYAPKRVRENYLIDLLLKTDRDSNHDQLRAKALQLIGKDANQADEPYGQRFLDCYPYSDFILDCAERSSLAASVSRFIKCFFSYPFVSPSADEYGLATASLVALRSTDLSRQVGAAIFSPEREIVALGCNEVPKFDGGTYWEDSPNDKRDFQKGIDSNFRVKVDMIRDLLVKLSRAGWLKANLGRLRPEALVDKAVDEEGPLSDAMIGDVIEFGRMLHAEMNAITSAGRMGRSLAGTTLYCTTMPCHLCTKLAVGCGIRRVVYLQPYHKSLVEELFEDSVSVDEESSVRVCFEPFHGVTPNAYQNVFSKGRRKNDDGSAESWNPAAAGPVAVTELTTYLKNEYQVATDWAASIRASGIPLPRRRRNARKTG